VSNPFHRVPDGYFTRRYPVGSQFAGRRLTPSRMGYMYHKEMSVSRQDGGRTNQKLRTRRALVDAAIELTREGRSPSVAEVADAALVSRATAYRYFPTSEALALQVAADLHGPLDEKIFDGLGAQDVPARVDRVVRELSARIFGDESLYRNMLRASLDLSLRDGDQGTSEIPVREGRRRAWIATALKPVENRLNEAEYERLAAALALACGTEAMIVMRDVCRLDADSAVEVLAWTAETLVMRALEDAQPHRGKS
jgi:AcrR family transcriptional regulator